MSFLPDNQSMPTACEMSVWKGTHYLNRPAADPKPAAPCWSENHACLQKQQDYSCSNTIPREDAPTKVF